MKALKILALVVILVISVLSGLFFQAGTGIERTFLNPGFYQGLVRETDIVPTVHRQLQEAMPAMILQGMQQEQEEEIPAGMEEVMRERLSLFVKAFGKAFDPEWLEEQLLLVVNDVLALVKGETNELAAVIDLREGKRLLGDYLVEGIKELPAEQLEAMGMSVQIAEPMVEEILRELEIPDQLPVSELIRDKGTPAGLEQAVKDVQSFRTLYPLVPVAILALSLVFSCLLAGVAGGMRWFGAATAISGVVFLAGLSFLRNTYAHRFTAGLGADAPVEPETVMTVLNFTGDKLTPIPLGFIVTGLVLLAASILVQRSGPKSQAEDGIEDQP